MSRPLCVAAVLLVAALVSAPLAIGQMVGSRGGAEATADGVADLPFLDSTTAEGYITIEGRAEVRVQPTDVRMVLAVTSEAETAPKCQQSIDAAIDGLRAAWSKMGIGPERVVVDFIAVLPRYEWVAAKHGDIDAEIEKKVAYRPRNTYYRGLYIDGDVQPHELPMNPEISVISTVRIYFKSPAANDKKKGRKG